MQKSLTAYEVEKALLNSRFDIKYLLVQFFVVSEIGDEN